MSVVEEYLRAVAGQIRVKRAREPLTRELRAHIEDRAAALEAEGAGAEAAQTRAVREMGDALLVGGQLDMAHRPRPAWRGLGAALMLVALGLLAQSALSGVGVAALSEGRCLPLSLVAAGLLLLLGFSDYTWWVRLAWPTAIVWGLLWLFRANLVFLEQPYWLARSRLLYLASSPQILCAVSPAVLALLVCALRGRKRGAFAFCAAFAALPAILALGNRFTGYDPNASLLLALLCPLVLILALRGGFFAVKRRGAYILLAALFLGPLCVFARDFVGQFAAGGSYWAEAFGSLLRGEMADDPVYFRSIYLLPGAIARWGWTPFVLFTAGLAALLGYCFVRFARLENRMGALIGLTATAILAARTALFYLASFSDYREGLCLPLLSQGDAMLLADALLIGLMLSVWRGQALPETEKAGGRAPA